MTGLPRSLPDWLEHIEHAHPAEIDMGLERIAKVATRAGLPAGVGRVITVAGTNGKGSCVAVIERLLLAGGYSVGAYTSPHLRRYNERVRLQGLEVTDQDLCRAFSAVEEARHGVPLTYFEYGTLAALEVFRVVAPDFLVLEVGLGGRLDAVNIVDADVALISSIELDHTEWLGSDRESIGREKAGIMRHARPVVCADRNPPQVLQRIARDLAAPWYCLGQEFDCSRGASGEWHWRGSDGAGAVVHYDAKQGPQLIDSNVAGALQALLLAGVQPEPAMLAQLLPRINVPGRYQKRRIAGVEWVLDVAHNPAGMGELARRLARDPCAGRTAVVFAAMADKDLPAMVAQLAAVAARWLLVDLPLPRAAPAGGLVQVLQVCAITAPLTQHAAVQDALQQAVDELQPGDRLVVCGSFHLVGPALDWLDNRYGSAGSDS
jgi:dihydrofolate synthase / folylpolyglutamate synthase